MFQNVITKQFPIQHIDTINPTASASVSGGYFGNEIIVSLSMSEPGTIYYTLNGEDPSLSSIKCLSQVIMGIFFLHQIVSAFMPSESLLGIDVSFFKILLMLLMLNILANGLFS